VDLNPLAVELCKVALWLEAHTPGEPLNFLDHHIKCGNAIVGFVTRDELEKGIPDEAFKTLPGYDKEIAAAFRKTNKTERAYHKAGQQSLSPDLRSKCQTLATDLAGITNLPETTPAEIAEKKSRYEKLQRADALLLRQLAAIPIAQFYLPKTAGNKDLLVTDASFRQYLAGRHLQGQATAAAWATAERKRAFHWFLEFPEIIERGGFDSILGNPPYLGGTYLSSTYGHPFCEYARWQYSPTGLSDLIAFFLRRIYSLLRPNGFTAFITTNSIKDGDIRKDGLDQVIAAGGHINMAVRGIKWPGVANLVVSLVSIYRGVWNSTFYLDGKQVHTISSFLEDEEDGGEPFSLELNCKKVYKGPFFLGDGFLLQHNEAEAWKERNPILREVIFPVTNGQEINNSPIQAPGRQIINFFDWSLEKASRYVEALERVEKLVKPLRATDNRQLYREKWWHYGENRPGLRAALNNLYGCFVVARTTKYLNFSAAPTNCVFTDAISVFTTDRWDHYAVVQSTIHEVWARKYSGALKQDLRYSPSKCFDTFAFPSGQWQMPNPDLALIGERYHEHRRDLMLRLWLGLTDIYNLFHARELEGRLAALHAKRAKSGDWHNEIPAEHRPLAGSLTPEEARTGIETLRALHVALDQAVLTAYGWQDLPLTHDFQEVETLPENDRTRYTISPTARKTLLTRLLQLNHQRAAEEKSTISAATPKATIKTRENRPKREDELI
jgi:hypothetical protein